MQFRSLHRLPVCQSIDFKIPLWSLWSSEWFKAKIYLSTFSAAGLWTVQRSQNRTWRSRVQLSYVRYSEKYFIQFWTLLDAEAVRSVVKQQRIVFVYVSWRSRESDRAQGESVRRRDSISLIDSVVDLFLLFITSSLPPARSLQVWSFPNMTAWRQMCERTQSDDGTLLFLPRVCHRRNTFMCIIGKVNKNDGRSSTWTHTWTAAAAAANTPAFSN